MGVRMVKTRERSPQGGGGGGGGDEYEEIEGGVYACSGKKGGWDLRFANASHVAVQLHDYGLLIRNRLKDFA